MYEFNSNPRSNWGSNQPYECVWCGATTMGENIEERNGLIKCIVCGYRVLKKTKPPVVKRVSQDDIRLNRRQRKLTFISVPSGITLQKAQASAAFEPDS